MFRRVGVNATTWYNHSKYEKKKCQKFIKVAEKYISVTFLIQKFKVFLSKCGELRQDLFTPSLYYCKKMKFHIFTPQKFSYTLKQRANLVYLPNPKKLFHACLKKTNFPNENNFFILS